MRRRKAQVPGPQPVNPSGLPVGSIRPTGLLPLLLRLSKMLGMFMGRSWRLYHMSLFTGFGLRTTGPAWMTSGMPGVLVQRRVSFVPIVGLVGLLLVTLRCILEGVGCGFVSVVLVAGLLEVPVLAGYTESVRETRLTLILLSTS